jgi:hypothetical protein
LSMYRHLVYVRQSAKAPCFGRAELPTTTPYVLVGQCRRGLFSVFFYIMTGAEVGGDAT